MRLPRASRSRWRGPGRCAGETLTPAGPRRGSSSCRGRRRRKKGRGARHPFPASSCAEFPGGESLASPGFQRRTHSRVAGLLSLVSGSDSAATLPPRAGPSPARPYSPSSAFASLRAARTGGRERPSTASSSASESRVRPSRGFLRGRIVGSHRQLGPLRSRPRPFTLMLSVGFPKTEMDLVI